MVLMILAVVLAGSVPVQEPVPRGLLLRSPRADVRLTCRGEEATDVVQPDEDYDGTSERDVVVVLGGGGEIWTSAGDDLICVYGSPRPDRRYGHGAHVVAGPGNDTVITYGGSNTIQGGDGDDLIFLNGAIESVEAGDGNDHIWALGASTAYIYGDDGNDLIIGSPGDDGLHGGFGNDFILGASGLDGIHGDQDMDTCFDTAAGASFYDCEDIVAPGLPESGGTNARWPSPSRSRRGIPGVAVKQPGNRRVNHARVTGPPAG